MHNQPIMKALYYKLKFIWLLITTSFLCPFVLVFPRNRRKILFGAWWGHQFADNPKYFLKFLHDHNAPYDYYWVGNKNIQDEVEQCPWVHFVRKGSLQEVWHVLTAKWAVWAISFGDDISTFPTFGRINQLSFSHGTLFKGVTYSTIDSESVKGNGVTRRVREVLMRFLKWARTQEALASFSTQRMVELMKYEVPLSFRPERSRAFGSARIDYLIHNRGNEDEIRRVRNKLSEILGLPVDKKWYLYMPTWRKGLALKFSFLKSERIKDYQKILDAQNAIIVEKQHPQVVGELGIVADRVGNIYTISKNDAEHSIDTQELLLACQRLITDYSSCCADFMTLERPEIFFMYDYDFYMKERGMTYRVEDVVAGPIAKTENELVKYLSMSDHELRNMKGPHWHDLIEGETGHACEHFADWVGLSHQKGQTE